MQKVVLDMQNYLMGDAIKMALRNNGDFQVELSQKPEETAGKCYNFAATAVIMEVTGYTPWLLAERMKIRDEVRRTCPHCKIVLLVDENAEKEVAEQVKDAKRDGLIDLFLYGSTSASFLTALMDTL
ncbi:50S ribosomal protein L36 [Dysosmobacter sp.]